ncbi:hypothetical protein P8452_54037 [Trifolium repens]|nr:hypothetical protein P8452_54037 [Trifolium repens]
MIEIRNLHCILVVLIISFFAINKFIWLLSKEKRSVAQEILLSIHSFIPDVYAATAPPRSHRHRRISFFQFRFILSMVSKGSHFKFLIDDSISDNQWHVSCGGGES